MNCSRVRQLIEQNPLSTLRATDLEAIRSHAAICPTCAEMLESGAELELELASLPEIGVRAELCDRVMESLATTKPAPESGYETTRVLFAHFLKNLSFVVATVALLTGVRANQWLHDFWSVDFGVRLGTMSSIPSTTATAGLIVVACLLFLAGITLTEKTPPPVRRRTG